VLADEVCERGIRHQSSGTVLGSQRTANLLIAAYVLVPMRVSERGW
jgi:hypothetical protein